MEKLHCLHHLNVRGLVDRDHRSDEEIAALRRGGLQVADVAEVENLFCIPQALEAAADQLKLPNVTAATDAAKQSVLAELGKGLNAQISARAISEIQFQLRGFGPKAGNADATVIQAALQEHLKKIDVEVIFKRSRDRFDKILSTSDYEAALRYYNCKGTTAFVAQALGMTTQTYRRMITGLVQADSESTLANEMRRRIS